MSYSFGLILYNLAGRRDPVVRDAWPDRPRGRLVWLHAPTAEAMGALTALARRLVEEDGLPVLITMPDPAPSFPGIVIVPPPADTPAEAQAFLAHWQPELAVFSDGEIRPAMLREAASRGLPVLMVDARAPVLPPGRTGWYPGVIRHAASGFRHVLAQDDAAARAFRKAGAPQVEASGRMEEQSAALPYVEADRAALAGVFATRPVWLAVEVAEVEEPAVIAAHREALRLSHRLLLILVPADPARAPLLAARMEETEGWSVAQRGLQQEPDVETEVYLPDQATECGLWYRLAPVTFMGGSLLGAGGARNPLEPAALGSAIIYGPRLGPYAGVFGRLGAARAARMVGSGDDLVQALGDLLSPDRAARAAHAAWSVASEGAEVTVKVVGLIRAILEGDA